MWYFVNPSHLRLLRREKCFDVKSAKKGVSLSLKLFATYISPKKDSLSDIKRHIFHHQRPFHVK